MDLKVDIRKKIKGMKTCIENEWIISNNDVYLLIKEYEKQEKMIGLMAKDISNFGKTNPEEIKKYYEKEVGRCLKTKRY